MATCKKIWLISEDRDDSLDVTNYDVVLGVQFSSDGATLDNASTASVSGVSSDDSIPGITVAGTTTVPGRGATYGTGAKIIHRKASRKSFTEGGEYFEVSIQYTTAKGSAQKPDGTNVKWNLDFSSDGIPYNEEINKDFSASPKEIRIPTGEPVQPALVREYNDEEFTIGFRTDVIDAANIEACRGNYNSDSITMTIKGVSRTFAAKTLKLAKASYAIDNDTYWKVQYVIQYRADTWISKIQPKSYNILKSDGVTLKRIQIDGKDTPTQQFIAADGKSFIPAGTALPTPAACGTEFQTQPAVAFASLLSGIETIP